MGARKKKTAIQLKEIKKQEVSATLKNSPISPRKMRLVADAIRGVAVQKALQILKFIPKHAALNVEKLLLSAVSNRQKKNEGADFEDANLYVKYITVDGAGMLKRLRPAPQGRGHRIRKRSNHVKIVLGSKNQNSIKNGTKNKSNRK